MIRSTLAPLLLALAATPACFQMAGVGFTPGPQRAAFALSAGNPTQKSPEALEATIQRTTTGFDKGGSAVEGRLEAPVPFVINGARGTCYVVVMRLGNGAAWGRGAQAGLRFSFTSPTHPGFGGPGVVGPGAVASVGCAEADGPITLSMSPMIGQDPIGQGPFSQELWTHALTPDEAANREADKQRQFDEAARFKEDRARDAAAGCAKCDARYQGCKGAGRPSNTCRSEFDLCAVTTNGGHCPDP